MTDIADYRVREILVEDERFVLYRASDASDAKVLLKVSRAHASPDDLSAFSTDFLVARRCDAPSIPRPMRIDTIQAGGTFQVRQDVPGRPLSTWLEGRSTPRPLGEALEISLAIVKAIEALHARGFVHCDIRPDNLLYDAADGAVYFADCAQHARVRRHDPEAVAAPDRQSLRRARASPSRTPACGRPNGPLSGRRHLSSAGHGRAAVGRAAKASRRRGRRPDVAAAVADGPCCTRFETSATPAPRRFGRISPRACSNGAVGASRLIFCPTAGESSSATVQFPDQVFGREGVRSALYDSFVNASHGHPALLLLTARRRRRQIHYPRGFRQARPRRGGPRPARWVVELRSRRPVSRPGADLPADRRLVEHAGNRRQRRARARAQARRSATRAAS